MRTSVEILTELIHRVNRTLFLVSGKCWCCGLYTVHAPKCLAFRDNIHRLVVKRAA